MMVGTTGGTTGIAPLSIGETKGVRLYPNPNNGSFQVVFAENSGQTATISVMNILGESVYETNAINNANASLTINLNNLANGTYFVQVVNVDKVYTNKLIISK
jgi:hypothetical protein